MKKTALFDIHQKLGASFTDFGGWEMPVRYGSDLAEHKAVRESAGVFDISHMAEITVSGIDAANFLDSVLVNQASKIETFRAKYSLLLNEQGGIIDDLIVYRLKDEKFLVVANASNRDQVATALIAQTSGFDVAVVDESDDWAMIALQGPESAKVLSEFTTEDLKDLGYYAITEANVEGTEALIARTGYTGEDGFEIYIPTDSATKLFEALANHQLVTPCGLAARDSLRLEAGMPLYGNELDAETSPLDAGFERVVSNPGSFTGSEAMTKTKKLVGLQGAGKRAARHGYQIMKNGIAIGEITSGILSPTLGYPIAMGYVNDLDIEIGEKLMVDIRGTEVEFSVVKLPFYKRAK